MNENKSQRPLHNIMRKHAKAEHIQKRQSNLIMCFANNEHAAVAKLLQKWLQQEKNKNAQ